MRLLFFKRSQSKKLPDKNYLDGIFCLSLNFSAREQEFCYRYIYIAAEAFFSIYWNCIGHLFSYFLNFLSLKIFKECVFLFFVHEKYPLNPVKSFIMGIKTEFNDSEVNRWFIKYTETEGRSGVIRRLLSWAHFSSGLKNWFHLLLYELIIGTYMYMVLKTWTGNCINKVQKKISTKTFYLNMLKSRRKTRHETTNPYKKRYVNTCHSSLHRQKPTVNYASFLSWWREERCVINRGFPTIT